MRRRRIVAEQAAAETARTPEQEQALDEPKSTPRGECPKCKKHVGTGLYAHARHCKGVY
jgi:hypothetical protein